MNEKVLTVTKRSRCPSHPGGILKRLYLKEWNITVSEFAEKIGVSRKAISAIVNEHKSVTPEMAMRLSMATKTTPQLWLNLQTNYDLWHIAHEKQEVFSHIKPLVFAMA